jgi:prepilin-type N-terminal cleavage/methylation domain-containing protein
LRGFSLIETLVAIMIFLIVSSVFFNISNYSKHMITLIKRKNDFVLKSSVALIEGGSVKNLYEELINFKINDDEVIRDLKKYQISVESVPILNKEINLTNSVSVITIYKKIAKNREFMNYVYGFKIK